ncbi:A/G-specific adenine glycosylase [Paraflavisolibacter sp. H34]|uniref:A/G-specific adenine glycosylase n=1 Tax=Huijunlia imazamoxiresistens TaxID=3127457 RepID=UPI00301733B6
MDLVRNPKDSAYKKFSAQLLQWNREANNRQMPWKGEKDPYRIWLSEIILQQTRVEQGLDYYRRFIAAFPTVHDLAAAPELQVFKLWEGLGYYSRCRNLMATARYVSGSLGGVFPTDLHGLLQLKGVGPYTAAAIASFAYNLPHAVLDGNVFRVLARIGDEDTPSDTTEGKKLFARLAQETLPEGQAAEYNQAIMDFGATVCKPAPDCADCFFNKDCRAFFSGRQLLLPVKLKQTLVRERWFHYYIISDPGHRFALRQRTARDIWQHLYEFPLVETGPEATAAEALGQLQKSYGLTEAHFLPHEEPAAFRQRLSHQLIHFTFTSLQLRQPHDLPGVSWVKKSELKAYPFPRTLKKVLEGVPEA